MFVLTRARVLLRVYGCKCDVCVWVGEVTGPWLAQPYRHTLLPRRVRVELTKRKSFGHRSLDNRASGYSRASSCQREDTLRCNCSLPIRVEIIARSGTRNCPESGRILFFHGGQLLRGFGRKGVADEASTRISFFPLQFHDDTGSLPRPSTHPYSATVSRSIFARSKSNLG